MKKIVRYLLRGVVVLELVLALWILFYKGPSANRSTAIACGFLTVTAMLVWQVQKLLKDRTR